MAAVGYIILLYALTSLILLNALTSLILLNALTLPTSSGAAGLDDRSGRLSQAFEPLPYESPALQRAINISARALTAPKAREETERLL